MRSAGPRPIKAIGGVRASLPRPRNLFGGNRPLPPIQPPPTPEHPGPLPPEPPGHPEHPHLPHHPHHHPHVIFYPVYGGWAYTDPVWDPYAQADQFLIDGLIGKSAASEVVPAAPDTRPLDVRAEEAFREGRLESAAQLFRDYLRGNDSDVEARRVLGLVLIDLRSVDAGIAEIALAYRAMPLLARIPFEGAAIEGGAAEMSTRRSRVLARTSSANPGVDHAGAYLVGAILAQAEGRTDIAARLVERAEGTGLEARVAEVLRDALGMPSRQRDPAGQPVR